MTLFFAPCFFQVHILDRIFLTLQTLKRYQVDLINWNSGCRLTGRSPDWKMTKSKFCIGVFDVKKQIVLLIALKQIFKSLILSFSSPIKHTQVSNKWVGINKRVVRRVDILIKFHKHVDPNGRVGLKICSSSRVLINE